MMSWIFTGILALSTLAALCLGNGQALSASVIQGAQSGITLAISLAGSLCLWSGVGALMERIGLTRLLSRLLSPLLGMLFPDSRQDPAGGDGDASEAHSKSPGIVDVCQKPGQVLIVVKGLSTAHKHQVGDCPIFCCATIVTIYCNDLTKHFAG